MSAVLRIATRASQLALWQANFIRQSLIDRHSGLDVELVTISTQGDREQIDPLRSFGGVGVFTREIQAAVLDGRADLAVHSLKDLPTDSTAGLTLAAIPARGLTADALILPRDSAPAQPSAANTALGSPADSSAAVTRLLDHLPAGALVGTGSPRRQAQLLRLRPDLQLREIRGNVDTRLRKLDEGQYAALVLAAAGLDRLGFGDRITATFAAPVMYHAVSQGALGLECRHDDQQTLRYLQPLTHPATWAAAQAERQLLRSLRAGCHAPVGVETRTTSTGLQLEAVVLSLDGRRRWTAAVTSPLSLTDTPVEVAADGGLDEVTHAAMRLGSRVADLLIGQGVSEVLNP
jgi:hydroxymethylbilane synthase